MNPDKLLQNSAQAGLGQLARAGLKIGKRGLSLLLKKVLALLAPYLASLLPILILALVAYIILFLFPKYMMESKVPGAEGKIVSIFNLGDKDTWTEKNDLELAAKYRELSIKSWTEGLEGKEEFLKDLDSVFQQEVDAGILASQQEQAQPHRLPWSVLAGVDRVAGDPVIHRNGLLPEPDPERHYGFLKPSFTWTTFQVLKVKKVTKKNENGTESESYEEHSTTVKLLDTANTFEANYKYHWIEKKQYFDDGRLKSIMPELKTVEKNGPYFTPLKELMAQYRITESLEIETVLELAELYDNEYLVDASILGARVEGFQLDTGQQYFTGNKSTVSLPVPAQYFKITSPYGMRIHPILKTRRMHTGIDLGAPSGAPVYSSWEGVVIWAGKKGAYGNAVIIDHGDVKTLYGHLSLITITRGSTVNTGQKIGLVGSTGLSTAPHLHFEVFKYVKGGMVYENPENYFK